MSWKKIARHNWIAGTHITESVDTANDDRRRYVATIRGFGGWIILSGETYAGCVHDIFTKVREIRDRIDAGDNAVFWETGPFLSSVNSIENSNLEDEE